jgi:hypothetical protein
MVRDYAPEVRYCAPEMRCRATENVEIPGSMLRIAPK